MRTINILNEIREELRANIDGEYRKDCQRYYKNLVFGKNLDSFGIKEKIVCYGVRTPIVRKIAKKYFKQIKDLNKREIFILCKELFKNKYNEEATIAIQWICQFSKQFENFNEVKDFEIFEDWLKKYIDNWSKCDDFCLHIIHPMIDRYPELIDKVKLWSHSPNIWLRRASAVSFITTNGAFYTTKDNLKDIFEVAETLLDGKEDLVQKGYGWMLKAVSVHNQKEVFDFVIKHKAIMPRTALRYAIEKMPTKFKKEVMRKH